MAPGTNQAPSDDRDLASFGYKQELTRSLGAFSTFAAGFAFISILTGAFQLFFFAFGIAGPGFWWSWVIAFAGQMLFALCFAELAVHYPLAGSIYNWSKYVAHRFTSWLAGWSMLLALVVSTAAVALAWQFVLPLVSNSFWIYGDGTGKYDAATNGVILGAILIMLTTIVNAAGSKVFAILNNIGVTVELIASALMIVFLAIHIQRGPQVVMQTHGTGAGHTMGYVGALMMALLLGTYIMWGFDTAGSVGEETVNPRKTNPTAIIRALAAAGIIGGVLMLVALMAVGNIHAEELSTSGLPYILQSVLGKTLGNVFLVCVAIAIFVCGLCNQAGAIRMIFAMSRDNGLPGGKVLAHVSEKTKTPIVPAVIVGIIAILILLANIRQPQIFVAVTSCTVILALFSYVLVVGPLALKKMRGEWEQPEKGYFTLGRWGLAVSIAAFVWGVFVIVDIAWPRASVYNPFEPFHWYLQWSGILFPVIVLAAGAAWYGLVQRHRIGILTEHAAGPADGSVDLGALGLDSPRTIGDPAPEVNP